MQSLSKISSSNGHIFWNAFKKLYFSNQFLSETIIYHLLNDKKQMVKLFYYLALQRLKISFLFTPSADARHKQFLMTMANNLLIFLLISLPSLITSSGYVIPSDDNDIKCPSEETLTHCSCKPTAQGLQIVCDNFKSSQILYNELNALRNFEVYTLLLYNVDIKETLPIDIFKGMKIKEIKIQKSKLKFRKPVFSGLDSSLTVLNIQEDSKVKCNNSFILAKLTNLNEFYVNSNRIQMVTDAWLNDKVPNVHVVQLDYNDISVIQDRAFESLHSLKLLSLSDNRIKVVKRTMLPQPAEHLTRIDLSYNELGSLPEDFFTGMPNLREVIVSGNELKTLPEVTWKPVWKELKKVYLDENQLECDEKMLWIRKLRRPYELSGNCVSPKDLAGRPLKEFYETT